MKFPTNFAPTALMLLVIGIIINGCSKNDKPFEIGGIFITTTNKKPVPSVRVDLYKKTQGLFGPGSELVMTDTTDQNGQFLFPNLPKDEQYTIDAHYFGADFTYRPELLGYSNRAISTGPGIENDKLVIEMPVGGILHLKLEDDPSLDFFPDDSWDFVTEWSQSNSTSTMSIAGIDSTKLGYSVMIPTDAPVKINWEFRDYPDYLTILKSGQSTVSMEALEEKELLVKY